MAKEQSSLHNKQFRKNNGIKKCFLKNTTIDLKRIWQHLDSIKFTLAEPYRERIIQNPSLSAVDMKNLFLGKAHSEENYLSDIIAYHKEKTKSILAPEKLKNYKSTEKYISKFLKKQYHQENFEL